MLSSKGSCNALLNKFPSTLNNCFIVFTKSLSRESCYFCRVSANALLHCSNFSFASELMIQCNARGILYLVLVAVVSAGGFPFRKQAMPFSQHLENFLTLNKFFSTKLKKKENM